MITLNLNWREALESARAPGQKGEPRCGTNGPAPSAFQGVDVQETLVDKLLDTGSILTGLLS